MSPMFIQYEIRLGEAELEARLRYLANPLTHAKRLHRTQGVWGNLHAVCSVPADATRRPILTPYNQNRLTAHRV